MSVERFIRACCLATMILSATAVLPAAETLQEGKDLRLAAAAMRGDQAAVRSLLKEKADVNAAQGDGMTALHWAALNNNLEIAQMGQRNPVEAILEFEFKP